MPDALNLMIAVRAAELDAVAMHLRQPKDSVSRLAEMQPGMWAERLAQLAVLCDYADSLPAEFAGFVAKHAR